MRKNSFNLPLKEEKFLHFGNEQLFDEFLRFIKAIGEFLNPDFSYTIKRDHSKTIRE